MWLRTHVRTQDQFLYYSISEIGFISSRVSRERLENTCAVKDMLHYIFRGRSCDSRETRDITRIRWPRLKHEPLVRCTHFSAGVGHAVALSGGGGKSSALCSFFAYAKAPGFPRSFLSSYETPMGVLAASDHRSRVGGRDVFVSSHPADVASRENAFYQRAILCVVCVLMKWRSPTATRVVV